MNSLKNCFAIAFIASEFWPLCQVPLVNFLVSFVLQFYLFLHWLVLSISNATTTCSSCSPCYPFVVKRSFPLGFIISRYTLKKKKCQGLPVFIRLVGYLNLLVDANHRTYKILTGNLNDQITRKFSNCLIMI